MADNDEVLLGKINAAVADLKAAEKTVTTAQTELVSKSKVVGQLLLEAKKRHPKPDDFEAFLKCVVGLKRSRVYDYLRVAGGRTTDDELREDARERKRKSRAKKKLPTPTPTLPRKLTVEELKGEEREARMKADWLADHPGKTAEDAEIAGTCSDPEEAAWCEWALRRYGQRDVLDTPPGPVPTLDTKPTHSVTSPHVTESTADERAAKESARALAEFTVACRHWLPRITVEADRQEARNLVATLTCSKCREAA
jgi:hypothetical protein